jgi:GDP-L-fucose synthase
VVASRLEEPIYVAGHRGLIGSALVRALAARGYAPPLARTHAELDLRDERAAAAFFQSARPRTVVLAAARVGGIEANRTRPGEFILDNLRIQTNVIECARAAGVARLVYLGSSCMYPRACAQPMRVEDLWTGPVEPTSEAYAVAKLAGLAMVDAYRRQYALGAVVAIPTGVYGPGDNFDPASAHVAAAMLRKLHDAKTSGAPEVVLWGTGTPRRELVYVDDAADAIVTLAERYDGTAPVNVGVGEDVSIRELAQAVRDVVGYEGALVFDASKPDGAPRKLLDSAPLRALGWAPRTPLREGLARTYDALRAVGASLS